jgi:hypothetical protein
MGGKNALGNESPNEFGTPNGEGTAIPGGTTAAVKVESPCNATDAAILVLSRAAIVGFAGTTMVMVADCSP